jgi:N-acetylneuraminate synthase
MPVSIIAEIGINHNGSVEMAKQLISLSKIAGCDFVKFQKRTPQICVPDEQKSVLRETPWGEMTYLEYKERLEFDESQYEEIFDYSKKLEIECFASVWDNESVDFMKKFTTIAKIPSALVTNLPLCKYTRESFDLMMISTGMSTEQEIDSCVNESSPDIIFHTNSTYPAPVGELNLNYIAHLREKYPSKSIGYSGHEYGLITTFATVPMGAKWIERHITLNRELWGSDQKSSIEPSGLFKLVKGIRDLEQALQYPSESERILFEGELNKRKSLRGV